MDVRQAQSPPSPKLPFAFAPASIVNHTGQYGTLYLEQSMLNSEAAFRALWKIIAMLPPRSYRLDRVICLVLARSVSPPAGKHKQAACYGGSR